MRLVASFVCFSKSLQLFLMAAPALFNSFMLQLISATFVARSLAELAAERSEILSLAESKVSKLAKSGKKSSKAGLSGQLLSA
eukprot:2432274-Alexandrium_andersonii.AAC.1